MGNFKTERLNRLKNEASMNNQLENDQEYTPEEQALMDQATKPYQRYEVAVMADQRRAQEARERKGQAWKGSQAGRLLKQLGQVFIAYKECLHQDPSLEDEALEFDDANQRLFNRMKTTMERAHNAPRCTRIMAAGRRCRAPKVRGKKYCHMHMAMEEARPQTINLPSLDDANGIQVAIAKSAQALLDGKLEQKQASLLAYYLQLALSNVGRVNFEEDWEEKEKEEEEEEVEEEY